MSTVDDVGAVPIDELELVESEVHHIQQRLAEYGQEIRVLVGSVADVRQEQGVLRERVEGIKRSVAWAFGIASGLIVTGFGVVLTVLLTRGGK